MRPWSDRISILLRRDTREFSLSLSLLHVHGSRKGHWRTEWEDSHLQTRKRALIRNQPCQHLNLSSSLQNCEKINFCCLSHPVYGILLLQPKVTNACAVNTVLDTKQSKINKTPHCPQKLRAMWERLTNRQTVAKGNIMVDYMITCLK